MKGISKLKSNTRSKEDIEMAECLMEQVNLFHRTRILCPGPFIEVPLSFLSSKADNEGTISSYWACPVDFEALAIRWGPFLILRVLLVRIFLKTRDLRRFQAVPMDHGRGGVGQVTIVAARTLIRISDHAAD